MKSAPLSPYSGTLESTGNWEFDIYPQVGRSQVKVHWSFELQRAAPQIAGEKKRKTKATYVVNTIAIVIHFLFFVPYTRFLLTFPTYLKVNGHCDRCYSSVATERKTENKKSGSANHQVQPTTCICMKARGIQNVFKQIPICCI